MTTDQLHKFDKQVKMTYSEHFHRVFKNRVSILKKLESKIGRDELHAILLEWSTRRGAKMIQRKIESFEDFKSLWKSTARNEFFSHVVTVEFPEDTDTVLKCKYSECLYAKTFRDLEAEDLGYILVCHPDFSMTEAMHPNLRLERSKTLMQGHDCCDHTYVWKE